MKAPACVGACIAFAARESSFARTVWLESGTAGEERERMVGARKQTFSQLGRDAQPHRGLQWEKVKGAEEGRSCSLASLRCEGAFLLVY